MVLDPGFLLASCTRESFSQIASNSRQLVFGVTLAVTNDTIKTVPWLQEMVAENSVTLIVLPTRFRPPESYFAMPYTDVLPFLCQS
ncbi:MAG: hypothetical protein QXW56_09060 [Nitrososphaerota archaeon]